MARRDLEQRLGLGRGRRLIDNNQVAVPRSSHDQPAGFGVEQGRYLDEGERKDTNLQMRVMYMHINAYYYII